MMQATHQHNMMKKRQKFKEKQIENKLKIRQIANATITIKACQLLISIQTHCIQFRKSIKITLEIEYTLTYGKLRQTLSS